ncbi:MAG: DUF1565 domain-containing protein, partial [Candidatus Neomarinimicrobiota bacterium]
MKPIQPFITAFMILVLGLITRLSAQIGGVPMTWLSATPGNNSVRLAWDPVNDPGLSKYIILRGRHDWNMAKIDSIPNPTASDTVYTDTGVQNDSLYYYTLWVEINGMVTGNSDTVAVKPTDKLIAELLPNAASTSSGGTDGGYPLNTFYEDFKYQGLYTHSDLSNAGLNPGANIVALEIYPSQSPGMDLDSFRVATAFTNLSNISDWVTTTVGYGPAARPATDFPMGQWVRVPINPIIWDGSSNLVVEFSNDNSGWANGGGVYLRDVGNNRCLRGWSDSQAGHYPFNTSMTVAADRYVPWLRVVYTEPAVLPPTNLTATGSYGQVTLNWTASITADVVHYIIYRDGGSGTLAAIDTVANTVTSYTDATVTNGVTYSYAVAAQKSTGEVSSLSSSVSATPQVAPPTHLTATAASHQVTLSWTAPAGSGAARILIYRGTSAATLAIHDSTADATVTSYTDSGLPNGITYFYALRTRAADGTRSDWTATVQATPNYTGPVWWVATNGSNSNDGSETGPFLTIQHAIDMANDGDTVKIKPGTYSGFGNYNLDLKGTELVVMGVGGPDSVTIDVQGSATNPRRGFKDLDHNYSDTTKIIGLHIINAFAPLSGDVANGDGGAMLFGNPGDITIQNCRIGPGNKAYSGAG